MPDIFYIGASPIGGLHDVTKRTLDIIEDGDYIVCECIEIVKHTIEQGKWKTNAELLEYVYDIRGSWNPNENWNGGSPLQHGTIKPGIQELILKLIKEGKKMIYMPERGSIGIEDPGQELMLFLQNNGVKVINLPGVSSIIASYIVANANGLGPSHRAFTFQPLVDLNKEDLEKYIKSYKNSPNALIFMVHDPEMLDALKLMEKYYGPNRKISICMNVSLDSERVIETTIGNIVESFKEEDYFNMYTTIVVDRCDIPLPNQD